MTYVRVYSGKVSQGAQVINSTKGKKERIGKMFQMHSNKKILLKKQQRDIFML